jgi:hypothetical protein
MNIFNQVGICKRVQEMWALLKRICEKYGMNVQNGVEAT